MAGAAVVVAGALTVAFDGDGSGRADVLAGSGDAPANTTYSQPTGGAMTMGATATFTTPSVGACGRPKRCHPSRRVHDAATYVLFWR